MSDDTPIDREAESKARRKRNREYGLAKLREAGVLIQVKNKGAHLIVRTKSKLTIEYWPGTGLWRTRTTPPEEDRGIQSLLQRIKQEDLKL